MGAGGRMRKRPFSRPLRLRWGAAARMERPMDGDEQVTCRWSGADVLARARRWLTHRPRLRRWWRRLGRPARLGALSRLTPVSDNWGFDRGTPIDRYYIEQFLARHGGDIRGAVLAVKDDTYTRRFARGVDRADVVDIDPANPRATIHADLADARSIADGSFDCVILTQTLHLIYDVEAVVRHAHRILRPGGIFLATVPVVSGFARWAPSRRTTGASRRRRAIGSSGPRSAGLTPRSELTATCWPRWRAFGASHGRSCPDPGWTTTIRPSPSS